MMIFSFSKTESTQAITLRQVAAAWVIAVGVASNAQAQSAEDGSVQIYGTLDTAVRHVNEASAAGSVTQFASGLNTSRIGFKGSEDVGAIGDFGRVHALFRLESGFAPGTGTSSNSAALFDRSAYAGLAGAQWDVRFGRQEGFGYELMASGVTDPLAAALNVVDYATPAAASGQGAVLGANPLQALYSYTYGQLRFNNAIKVDLGLAGVRGLHGGVLYSLSSTAGSSTDNTVRALSLGDTLGPVQVQGLVQQSLDSAGRRSTLGVLAGTVNAAVWRFQAGVHELHVASGFSSSGLGNGAGSSGILGNTSSVPASLVTAPQDFHFTVSDLGITWDAEGKAPISLAVYHSGVSGKASSIGSGEGHAINVVLLGKLRLSKRTTIFADLDGSRSTGTLAQSTVNKHPAELGYTLGVNHRF